jgi:hypothetical protein
MVEAVVKRRWMARTQKPRIGRGSYRSNQKQW